MSHNTLHVSFSQVPPQQSVNLASFPFADSKPSGTPRPAPPSRPSAGKRSRNPPRDGAGRHAKRTPPASRAQSSSGMGAEGERRERNVYLPSEQLHRYAHIIPDRNINFEQAIALAKSGKCVMCEGPAHGGPKQCPLVKGHPDRLEKVTELAARRHAANREYHNRDRNNGAN